MPDNVASFYCKPNVASIPLESILYVIIVQMSGECLCNSNSLKLLYGEGGGGGGW